MASRLQTYTISDAASLAETLLEFATPPAVGQRRKTCLCAVDASSGRLSGLVSERDVIKAAMRAPSSSASLLLVREFMVPAQQLTVCGVVDFLNTNPLVIATLLARAGYKHLPVVEASGAPLGVLDAIAVSEQLCAATSTTGVAHLVVNLTSKAKHVVVVRHDATAAEVVKTLMDAGSTAAIVLPPDAMHAHQLGGIVTLSDVLRRTSHDRWDSTQVSTFMTSKSVVKTISRDRLRGAADYLGVLSTLASKGFRHMPVVSSFRRGKRHVVIVDDIMDILECNRALTDGLPAPEGILVPLRPLVSTSSHADDAAPSGEAPPSHSAMPREDSHAASGREAGAAGEPLRLALKGKLHVPLTALDWKKLADLKQAYTAVENGRKPTERERKRLEMCLAKMDCLIDDSTTHLNQGAIPTPELQALVAALHLCASASRARATWGYILGSSASEYLSAIQEAATWLQRAHAVYARASALGMLQLDASGYPTPTVVTAAPTSEPDPQQESLPLGGKLHFYKDGESPTAAGATVEISLHPRFAAFLLLEQATGFLRYLVAEASVGGVPPREQRAFVLSNVFSWVVRGTAGLDVASLATALATASSAPTTALSPAAAASADGTSSDAMDAVTRLSELLALVEEVMMHAAPAAYQVGWGAGSIAALLPLAGVADAAAPPTNHPTADRSVAEALDMLAYYVDIATSLEAVTSLGVCCEPVALPPGVQLPLLLAAAPVDSAVASSSSSAPAAVLPLGLVGAATAATALMGVRAVEIVAAAHPSIAGSIVQHWEGGAAQPADVAPSNGGVADSSKQGAAAVCSSEDSLPALLRTLGSLSMQAVELAALAATARIPLPLLPASLLAACITAVTVAGVGAAASPADAALLLQQGRSAVEGLAVRLAFGGSTGHALRQRYLRSDAAWPVVVERMPRVAAAFRLQREAAAMPRASAALSNA